jgi:uncharacterized membrane protein
MKSITAFVKTTMMGGLLVLFPLFGLAYLIVRIGGGLTSLIKPLLSFMPQNRFVGVAIADAAAVLILLLLCFVIGLIMKTAVGSALERQLTRVLDLIPGYKMFVRIARIMFDHKDPRGSPVVVQRGRNKQIGFLVEENSADEFTVFFPSAPSPFSGNIVIVKADTVEMLNAPAGEVLRVIATFGAGTRALLVDQHTKP